MLKMNNFLGVLLAATVSAIVWQLVQFLKWSEIQYIASAMLAISGVLYGFVTSAITTIAKAKNNKLVLNTTKTQYLPSLVAKLNYAKALLLVVCVVFLSSLFVDSEAKSIPLPIAMGIFIFSLVIYKATCAWREFSKFASHM